MPHLEQPAVTAEAIASFLRMETVSGDADATSLPGGGGGDGSKSALDKLNELLDKPLLDTGVPGGPLEPFKSFARTEPEAAQVLASVLAFGGFALVGRLLVAVAAAVRLF